MKMGVICNHETMKMCIIWKHETISTTIVGVLFLIMKLFHQQYLCVEFGNYEDNL